MGYIYQVVAGAALFGKPHLSMQPARRSADALRARWPEVEIERVQMVGNGNARRYWRWREGRWSTDWHTDPSPVDLARWAPETVSP